MRTPEEIRELCSSSIKTVKKQMRQTLKNQDWAQAVSLQVELDIYEFIQAWLDTTGDEDAHY
jgi:hypothetical protein